MALRRDLIDLLSLDAPAFRDRLPAVLDRHGLSPAGAGGPALVDRGPDAVAGLDHLADEDLSDFERDLVSRLRLLNGVPLGVTLTGPAYQDNPIVHVTDAVQRITGYTPAELHGENPRLLQGPETEAAAVADFEEALAIWEPVTVEVRNYRRDGTPFRNRVSLVPLEDPTGTVTNWVGVQEVVDDG